MWLPKSELNHTKGLLREFAIKQPIKSVVHLGGDCTLDLRVAAVKGRISKF